jgi:hypothetical protein
LRFKPYIIDRYYAEVDAEAIGLRWLGVASQEKHARQDLIAR